MTRDRRSGSDRRKDERFETNIEIEWEGLVGRRKGVITDISVSGCFVLCSGEVEDGESVKIFFPLSDGRKVEFWGEVVNHTYEIGFGMRFIELTEAQKEFLERFVDTLRND
ncbi:MAG: PilZ domain-containing protein [Pyrinomonadaceae bacterium]|nr:PilZ domain-containing protein [Pyrinomonadaceae bacterium]MCX7639432.1 PilZ domain-containing protein [Pyrinomonadaceae bacterium]MDW8304518.1 PilZ domain-containing protein [Acidobacteriota bacterium]